MSARLDCDEIPPFGVGRLILTAQLRVGVKSEVLNASFNATNGSKSSPHSVVWAIDRAANWRPISTVFPLQTMAGVRSTAGPFYFEIGEELDSPELTIEDEDRLFQLVGDVRIVTDSELKRRHIEFELTATPMAVRVDERYPIWVKMKGGEPSYYLLVANLQVSERAYFETPVVRMDETEKELILRLAFRPSAVDVSLSPQCYDVDWRWDETEHAVRLIVRENDKNENSDTEFTELNVSCRSAEGEEVSSKCVLVKPSL